MSGGKWRKMEANLVEKEEEQHKPGKIQNFINMEVTEK